MSFHDFLMSDMLQHTHPLTLGGMDYNELGALHLQLQPGQRSIQYGVIIVNDNVTEVNLETFKLSLHTDQDRVDTLPGFNHAIVTVMDDDGKLQKTYHICESRMCDVTVQK